MPQLPRGRAAAATGAPAGASGASIAHGRNERRNTGPRGSVVTHPFGALLDRRVIEEVSERDLYAERVAHARHDFCRIERVTAQCEEVIGHADALEAKHFLPDAKQLLLLGVARIDVTDASVSPGLSGWQRLAIDLARRCSRQLRQKVDDGTMKDGNILRHQSSS